MSYNNYTYPKTSNQKPETNHNDTIHNANYFNQLSDLMQNISDKGATIAQTEEGVVYVAETRIVVYKFVWDKNKGVFVKQRTRNTRNNNRNQKISESAIPEMEDIEA
jgi:hypothetical protein